LTLPYRLRLPQPEALAMINEARLRQRNLLDEEAVPLPKDIEVKVLELLVELLLGALAAIEGDRSDE